MSRSKASLTGVKIVRTTLSNQTIEEIQVLSELTKMSFAGTITTAIALYFRFLKYGIETNFKDIKGLNDENGTPPKL